MATHAKHNDVGFNVLAQPVSYVDINDIECIFIFGIQKAVIYETGNDKYQPLSTYLSNTYTKIINSCDDYFQSCVIDHDNKILYISHVHLSWVQGFTMGTKRITSIDIRNVRHCKLIDQVDCIQSDSKIAIWPSGGIAMTFSNVNSSGHIITDQFPYKHQMLLIGEKIFFVTALNYDQLLQVYVFDIYRKIFRLIDDNIEGSYLNTLKFDLYNSNSNCKTKSTSKSKISKCKFVNDLQAGMIIDCKDSNTWQGGIRDYYHARIEEIINGKDRKNWNKNNPFDQVNVCSKNQYRSNVKCKRDKYAKIHYQGWSDNYDEWIGISKDEMCDCEYKCKDDKHQFTMVSTQSLFRLEKKGQQAIYSKKHKKLMIIGRDYGLLYYKYINYEWHDYYNKFDLNGNQSYYKCNKNIKNININDSNYTKQQNVYVEKQSLGCHDQLQEPAKKRRKLCVELESKDINRTTNYSTRIDTDININLDEKEIERHFFQLLVCGFIKQNENEYKFEIPIDLGRLIFMYYFKPSDSDWMVEKVANMPVTCNSACVLVNNIDGDHDEIIILGHCDRLNPSIGKIYKYNIDNNQVTEIEHIQTLKQSRHVYAVYAAKCNRIFLFDAIVDGWSCDSVHSINLSSI